MSKRAQMPDGTILEFPDDTPDSVIDGVAKRHIAQASAPPPSGSSLGGMAGRGVTRTVQQAPRPLVPERYSRALSRGVGDIVQSVGDTMGIVSNPINATVNAATGSNLTTNMGEYLRSDLAGIEHGDPTVEAMNRFGTTGMLFGGGANALSQSMAPGALRSGLATMGANPVRDAIGGAGAGGASDIARQNGAGTWGQLGAGLLGALAAGGIASRFVPGTVPASAPRLPPTPGPPSGAQQVVTSGEQFGVPVFTSDLRPPSTFMGKAAQNLGERIPFAGTAGPRAAQNAARQAAVTRLAERYGAAPGAADDVIDDLVRTRGGRLSQLTAQRDAGLATVADNVDVPNALAAIDGQIARLERIGTPATRPVIGQLQAWRQAVQNKDMGVINAIRQEMGDAFKAPELAASRTSGEKAISSIYGPLRTDMGNAIEAAGGRGARSSWQSANDQLSAMAGELGARNFKGVLREADLTPDNIGKLLFSNKGSDVNRLYANLSENGRRQGQAAIIHKAMEAATDQDTGVVSPEVFRRTLNRLGPSVHGFFRGQDRQMVEGFNRLLAHTQRASQAGVMNANGQQVAPVAMLGGLGWLAAKIGFVPAGTIAGGIGGAARVYESAPVRNALLGLGRARPGTQAETRALSQVVGSVMALAGNSGRTATANDAGFLNRPIGVPAAAGDREEEQRRYERLFGR